MDDFINDSHLLDEERAPLQGSIWLKVLELMGLMTPKSKLCPTLRHNTAHTGTTGWIGKEGH